MRHIWIVAAVLAALLLGVLLALSRIGTMAPTATGWAARTICSGHLAAGRDLDAVLRELPPELRPGWLHARIGPDEDRVTVEMLGGWFPPLAQQEGWSSTAVLTEGIGCTLVHGTAPQVRLWPLEPLPAPDPSVPWPLGAAPALADDGTERGRLIDLGVDVQAVQGAIETALTRGVDGPSTTRALVVAVDGELIAEGYAPGIGPDTPLPGWELGRPLTDAIIGRLVHDSALGIDDRDLRADWERDERTRITVRDLLTMTEGLDLEESYEPGSDLTHLLFRPGSAAEHAAAGQLEATPGTRFSSSTGSSALLCDLAHDVSDLGPELARELVFAPLGMTSAFAEPDTTGVLTCGGGVHASARDWARLGQLYLDDGGWDGQVLLAEGWVAESTRPVAAADETPSGRHWWLNRHLDASRRIPWLPRDAFWGQGHQGQLLLVVPSERLVIVHLGADHTGHEFGWDAEAFVSVVIEVLEGWDRD